MYCFRPPTRYYIEIGCGTINNVTGRLDKPCHQSFTILLEPSVHEVFVQSGTFDKGEGFHISTRNTTFPSDVTVRRICFGVPRGQRIGSQFTATPGFRAFSPWL